MNGPFSDQQLRNLADDGQILPTDTVWKEGVERGVAASKVKNLFPPADAVFPNTKENNPSQLPVGTSSSENLTPASAADEAEKTPAPAYRPAASQEKIPKKRAVAGKGAIIVGQDGTNVKIRKKCTVCGHEDSCWHTMRITIGMNKAAFFCQNCRRNRQVEFRGIAT